MRVVKVSQTLINIVVIATYLAQESRSRSRYHLVAAVVVRFGLVLLLEKER